ncbi:MAG TPA: hypothetical protein VE690_22345 [Rhodopila sp.]|nr:hypothetical protein [Rhodopila sp.]
MAALLELNVLRAHEAPIVLFPTLHDEAGPGILRRDGQLRPNLTATWAVGADSRLACAWCAETDPLPD